MVIAQVPAYSKAMTNALKTHFPRCLNGDKHIAQQHLTPASEKEH